VTGEGAPSASLDARAVVAALIRELRDAGAITVRTPLGEGPLLAAETTINLGGSVIVKVHPDITSRDPRWREHERAVQERLEPLAVIASWKAAVERIEGAVRWVTGLVAAIVMLFGATTSTGALRVLAWLVIPPALAFLVRYVARPLAARLVAWAVRRALASPGGQGAPDPPPAV
jgi:hypothetical protein